MLDLVTLATPISASLVAWFVETMVVASAFAVVAVVAGRVRWLTPGPAARHALWLLVLIKLVTPPLIHWPWSVDSIVSIPRPAAVSESFVSTVEFDQADRVARIGDFEHIQVEVPAVEVSMKSADMVVAASPLAVRIDPFLSILAAWAIGSVGLVLLQSARLAKFSRTLTGSDPGPQWLIDEAEAVGRRLDVRVPPIRVVSGLSTPLVWCLGRPVLLVPLGLLKTMEAERWRAIVAHELAHLKRGDHWVRRLELVAGLGWWWCPLYWWVCRKLDFEAELACDAWAVWESPGDRLTYAESLIRIGTSLSPVDLPSPALGVVGTGHSFERRLTMILKDRVERRVSMPSFFMASALAALALPSWTVADEPAKPKAKSTFEVVVIDDATATVIIDDDDDDDESDDPKSDKSAKKLPKTSSKPGELDAKRKAIEVEIEAKFGPGSEFAKKMEALGKEMEAKFGDSSEFAKQVEALGKDLEIKFGPDSDFVKDLVKGIEVKIVSDGEGAKAGKQKFDAKQAKVEAKVKAAKEKADANMFKFETRVKAAKEKREEASQDGSKANKKIELKAEVREKGKDEDARAKQSRRIEALQSAIDKLQKELKTLKAETEKDEDDEQN